MDRCITPKELEGQEHWIVIGGIVYDVKDYLRRHPGGSKVLERFARGGDATRAFEGAKHSKVAHELLQTMRVGKLVPDVDESEPGPPLETVEPTAATAERGASQWQKFFTHEDRFQVHKLLGIYCLLHFIFRWLQVLVTGDAFSGSWGSLISVLPHGFLSCSSFIFHIPKERVADKPMIWQEFRAHNVVFALRSFVAFVILWSFEHLRLLGLPSQTLGRLHVAAAALFVTVSLLAMRLADEATARLRADSRESTTATMPYWEGCSTRTQGRFKAFYTLAQVLATAGVMASLHLSWSFIVMMPIQVASLLMTCVRKGVLSAKGYHTLYSISLVLPFFVGLRTRADFPAFVLLGLLIFWLRLFLPRGGTSAKYLLWLPVGAGRLTVAAVTGL